MWDDKRRDAQAEHELQRLDRLPAKLPALIKRPDPETGVDQRRGVKRDRDREKSPERGVVIDAGGKRIHRDVAERMVEEMADQIGEHNQAAGEADLPDADAADEFCDPLLSWGHAIQSNTHR
jgi:glycerol-3-phosphate dehydrogenase